MPYNRTCAPPPNESCSRVPPGKARQYHCLDASSDRCVAQAGGATYSSCLFASSLPSRRNDGCKYAAVNGSSVESSPPIIRASKSDDLNAYRFRQWQVCAKLINGAKVKIDATGNGPSVRVGGLYSSEAFVKSGGNVAISSCHGRITVLAAGPAGGVTLSSVNGTAQVSTGKDTPTTASISHEHLQNVSSVLYPALQIRVNPRRTRYMKSFPKTLTSGSL